MRLGTSLSVVTLVGSLAACTSDDDTPPDHQLARTTQLRQYQSCDALETDLKQMLTREAWADIDMANWYLTHGGYGYGGGAATDGAVGGAASPGGGGGGGRQEGVDYSGTNNQEKGVDEADVVKTDGYHIYALNGNRLHIFGVPQFGQLTDESVTTLEGHPFQMLVDSAAGRAVVFSTINVASLPDGHPLKDLVGWRGEAWYWRINQLTKLTVLDISNRNAPALVREVFFEGWYQTARKVDSTVRMAAYSTLDRPEVYNWWRVWNDSHHDAVLTKRFIATEIDHLQLSDLIPQLYVRTPDGRFTTNSLSQQSCQAFYRPSDSHARGVSTIISFDLLGASFGWDATHVISNYPTFYESQHDIVLAEPAHDWWWYWWFASDDDQLNVHVFDASVAGHTAYTGSGRVDGHLVNSFAIDEANGAIRLATTTGDWWRWWHDQRPTIENHVFVLAPGAAGRYDTIGHLGGIAVGERLMASRLLADRGYLVTYKSVDPLFTVDLSDNTRPRLVGELVVPGFSTYLHPLDANTVLSIGYEGSPTWSTDVAMFDVSDFAHPAQRSLLPLSPSQGNWTWSSALYDHKAFQYWGPKQLLAIPESNYTYSGGHYQYLSKLQLIDVDPVDGLHFHGAIDHSAYYQADSSHAWTYVDIRRSIFMGDYVYAISDKAITAHRTSDLGTVAVQTLPGYVEGDWWWWW
jgi:hypothetical protein